MGYLRVAKATCMVENPTYALSQSCSQIVYSAPDRVRLLSSTKGCGLLKKSERGETVVAS